MAITKPVSGDEAFVNVDFPILLPHEMLAHMYKKQPTLFKQLYIGGGGEEQTWGMELENF